MAGEIIRLGDKTSHGGVVIEGSPSDICMGKPIAFVGHKVQCPKCKGVFPIVEGAPVTTFYGKGVALAGMRTACGATLIARSSPMSSNAAAAVQVLRDSNPMRQRLLPHCVPPGPRPPARAGLTTNMSSSMPRPAARLPLPNMRSGGRQVPSSTARPTPRGTLTCCRRRQAPRL